MRSCTGTGRLVVAALLSPAVHVLLGLGLVMVPLARPEGEQSPFGQGRLLTPPLDPAPAAAAGPLVTVIETPAEREEPEPAPPPAPPPPPPPPPQPALRLGLEDSPHDVPAWLGFADPSPHAGELSSIDQPALEPNPARPAGDSQPRSDPASAERPEAVSSSAGTTEAAQARPPAVFGLAAAAARAAELRGQPTRDDDSPADAATLPEAVRRSQASTQGMDPSSPGPEEPNAGDAWPAWSHGSAATAPTESGETTPPAPHDSGPPDGQDAAGEDPSQAASEAEGSQGVPTPADPVTPDDTAPGPSAFAQEPAAAGAGTASEPVAPGEPSDKEADATSADAVLEVRPGRPAAGAGLDIQTRRPQFSRIARATASPGNPVVRISFDRSGRVVSARFVVRSGYAEVDEPVLNAVYLWTARGRALRDLRDGARLTITVRIVLR
ncbi:MAG TPA: hypothetical protein VD963_07680 [Phycisphaerales bacterium]|nr:hypothetical protein [Phycisphaerales bacterium]